MNPHRVLVCRAREIRNPRQSVDDYMLYRGEITNIRVGDIMNLPVYYPHDLDCPNDCHDIHGTRNLNEIENSCIVIGIEFLSIEIAEELCWARIFLDDEIETRNDYVSGEVVQVFEFQDGED